MDISASRHNALTYLVGMLRLASASKMGMLRLASASKIGADMDMFSIRCRWAECVRLPGFSDLANILLALQQDLHQRSLLPSQLESNQRCSC
jgi:hypothetical protein